jgi:hypothetical protein
MDIPTSEKKNKPVHNAKTFLTNVHLLATVLLSSIVLSSCGGGLSESFTGSDSTASSSAGEAPPTASNVMFTDDNGGNIEVGDTLTLSYTYDDVNGDTEGTTLFRWYSNGVAILTPSASSTIYTVENADLGTEITVGVTPVATSGNLTLGAEVFSSGSIVVAAGSILDTSHFRSMLSSTIVNCTLNNGSTTQCHELKFTVNNIVDGDTNAAVDDTSGSFCPTTRTDTNGGIGIYDGATGPGLQQLAQTLWDNMVGDMYDIIDDSDNVCTFDNNTMTQTNGVQAECGANCIVNTPDDTITVVYYIPVVPEALASDDNIGEIETVGTSLDGVPILGAPPSVANNGGNINALDSCGGHHDSTGYYHWHFIPESADAVLTALGVSGVNCASRITQATSALSGYAKDGYPIYAHLDNGGATPTGLDSCNGHTTATAEFPGGVYHYHALSDTAPNIPPCLKGASAATPAPLSFE